MLISISLPKQKSLLLVCWNEPRFQQWPRNESSTTAPIKSSLSFACRSTPRSRMHSWRYDGVISVELSTAIFNAVRTSIVTRKPIKALTERLVKCSSQELLVRDISQSIVEYNTVVKSVASEPKSLSTKRWTTGKLRQILQNPSLNFPILWEMLQKSRKCSHACKNRRITNALNALDHDLSTLFSLILPSRVQLKVQHWLVLPVESIVWPFVLRRDSFEKCQRWLSL